MLCLDSEKLKMRMHRNLHYSTKSASIMAIGCITVFEKMAKC